MRPFKLLINGELQDGAAGSMQVINPATGLPVAECPRADIAQLNQAVEAAGKAFPAWSALPLAERAQLLVKICDDLMEQAGEIAALVTAEQGKPLAAAGQEVMGAAYLGKAIARLDLKERAVGKDQGGQFFEQHYPLGVVALITPWNVPVVLLMCKAAPALLAGNCCVAKPAPTTPLSSLRMAEIFNKHLPPGVFNIITDANDLGSALTAHPEVAKISFTGSTATGIKVMQGASSALKRVTLELGGNDAAIVLDDADVKATAKGLFDGAMMNSGQICLAIKRAYVPASLHDALRDELVALAREAVVGDGADEKTEFGPLQNAQQFAKVKHYLEDAAARGATVHGGETLPGEGFFVRPAIVCDIDDEAPLVREEQFGPILPLLRYDDLEDAIMRANDSPLGLGGTVWSSNIERARQVASRLETGTVWINAHMNVDPFVSSGGAKQSGVGLELGQSGLEEFTQRRVVYVPGTQAG